MTTWTSNILITGAYRVALVTTPRRFRAQLKALRIPKSKWPTYLYDGGDDPHCYATLHELPSRNGRVAILTTNFAGLTGLEIAGVLCHEAVHIWQWNCVAIAEGFPSDEFEAYSIQKIFTELMSAYHSQVFP